MGQILPHHHFGVLQRVLTVLGDIEAHAEEVQQEHMHALHVGVQRGEVAPAAVDAGLHGPQTALLQVLHALGRELVGEVFHQHGHADDDELAVVGIIAGPDHGIGLQHGAAQQLLNLQGQGGQLGIVLHVEAELIDHPLVEQVGQIAAVHAQTLVIQRAGDTHGVVIVAEGAVIDFLRRVVLLGDDGVADLLRLLRAALLVQQHQAKGVVHAGTVGVEYALAVAPGDAAGLGIILGAEILHGLKHQRLAFAAQGMKVAAVHTDPPYV